jgi:lipopolysaccharide export system protein LptA
MDALVAALTLLGFQVKDHPIQDPIRNWTIHRREINPRTQQEEIVAIVRGDEAVPKGKEVFEVRGVRAQYFTEPRTSDARSERVDIEAAQARLDHPGGRLDLTDRVRVLHEDGTTLEAPSARVLFNRQYLCAPCGTGAAAPGKCPKCKGDLKTRTYTTLEVEPEFSLRRPGLRLSGRQLRADDRMGTLLVGRDGVLEMEGRPPDLGPRKGPAPAPPPAPGPGVATELRCEGPLAIRDLSEDRTRFFVEARDRVRIRRRDAAGTVTTLTSDATEITGRRHPDPLTGKAVQKPDPEKIVARGNLALSDTQGMRVSAETLDWEMKEDVAALGALGGPAGALLEGLGAVRYDTARLSGTPVDLAQGRNRVRARDVRVCRMEGRTWFSGDVSGDFVLGGPPESSPITLSCRTLEVVSAASKAGPKPRSLEARGDVRLGGLMEKAGEAPARAEADRFTWDLEEERGLLEGRPFVRVTQDRNEILAPKVVLEGRSTVVLKGPKRFRLVHKIEDREAVYTVTSNGDVTVDQARGRTTLTDGCSVRSDDFQLRADRMEIGLSPDGKSIQALRAAGNVKARRSGEGVTLYGDRVRFDPRDRSLSMIGYPRAAAEAKGRTVVTREIRFNEGARTTEFRGGADGILLVIEEAPK